MKYFIDICLVLDFIVIVSTFVSVIFYNRYRNKIEQISSNNKQNEKNFILLPAFKEQSLVNETLDYYSKIKGNNHVIMVITSEQEEYENKLLGKNIKTTCECVDEYLSINNDCNIIHLHGDYISGTKSTQLNFALNEITKSINVADYYSSYVGVYDFDSRPNLEVLEDLRKVICCQNNPEVVQQVPINLKNYSELVKNKNYAMIVHCYQSMIRSVGIELASLLLNLNKTVVPLYCMGAGMYLRLDTLVQSDGFPEPIDDLALGYRLYLQGKRFGLFPQYNSVESPNSIREVTKQDVGIFRGICYGLLETKRKSKLKRKIPTCCMIVHNILLRTVLPWIYLVFVVSRIILRRINLAVIFIIIMPLLRTLVGLYSLKKADEDSSKINKNMNWIQLFVYSYLWRFIRTVGSFKVFFRTFLKK